jgi:hypothetical protein
MPSLVILVTIHPASRFPYSIFKSSFIDTDKTSFFIIAFGVNVITIPVPQHRIHPAQQQ